MIDIKGLDKGLVLAALYDASQPLGMGFLHYDPKPMSVDEANLLLEKQSHFDYLKGRVMKINLSGDAFDERLYDRDNSEGAARAAIERFSRSINEVCSYVQQRDCCLECC